MAPLPCWKGLGEEERQRAVLYLGGEDEKQGRFEQAMSLLAEETHDSLRLVLAEEENRD